MKARRLVPWVMLALVAGCASGPHDPSEIYLAPGRVVQLVVVEPDLMAPDARDVGEASLAGARSGAGTGAAGGALGGLEASVGICGPLFLVCAPVLAGGGAIVGGTIGAAAGSVSGAQQGLPVFEARHLEAIMQAAVDGLDAAAILRHEFVLQAANRWALDPDDETPASVVLTLGIEKLYVEQYADDMLSLEMTIWMQLQPVASAGRPSRKILVRYGSQHHPVGYWTVGDGRNFRAELNRAFVEQGRAAVALLSSPGR